MTYLNVNEVDTAVRNLAQNYQVTSTLITLPNATVGLRTTHALQIGAGQPGTRDTVVVLGGVHAREWGSSDIVVTFATDLLAAYQANSGIAYGGKAFTAQQVRALVDGLHIVVFPLVNPDGLHYSQNTTPLWRKNRNATSCRHDAHRGVDINRNFDFLFDYQAGFDPNSGVSVTNNPCHNNVNRRDVYQGANAFSEAETQNVQWLLDRYTRTRWFVDVHNYGETIMYNWGDDTNQTVNQQMNFDNAIYDGQRGGGNPVVYGEYIPQADLTAAQTLAGAFRAALQAVRGKNYTAKASFHLYPTCGASDDYTFSRHIADNTKSKAYAFTVEFGEQFTAPWPTTQLVIPDVCAGLIGFSLQAAATAAPVQVIVPVQGGPPAQNNVVG